MLREVPVLHEDDPPAPVPGPSFGKELAKAVAMAMGAAVGTKLAEWGIESVKTWWNREKKP